MAPWVVERRKVSRRRTFRSGTTQGGGRRLFQSLGRFLAWEARMLWLSNSRMWAWCTRRSTAAMVVRGSLKIWSHWEKTRLLLIMTLRRS